MFSAVKLLGCSQPHTRAAASSAVRYSRSASSKRPRAFTSSARLLMLASVSGCRSPSTYGDVHTFYACRRMFLVLHAASRYLQNSRPTIHVPSPFSDQSFRHGCKVMLGQNTIFGALPKSIFCLLASLCEHTGRIGSRQHLAKGVPWGCHGGAQRSCGDHIHPIQLRFHRNALF